MAELRNQDRDLDVVLFGATGFTGALTAEYLAAHAPEGLRWALAGRNPAKLARVRDRLAAVDPSLADLELLHADVEDAASLAEVARRARVVITTVGPYLAHGEPLVAACAEAGTDYVDLTGEPEFVDRMYVAHHATAQRTGARIVHACGFDSIPHDLGAYFTVQQLDGSGPIERPRGGPRQRHVLGRHLPLGDHGVLPDEADEGGREPAPPPGVPARGPLLAGPGRQAAPGRRARLLAAAAAHPGPVRGRPQRRRPAGVRPEVPLLALRGHEDPALRRGRRGRLGSMVAAAQVKPLRNLLLGRVAQGDGPDESRRAKSWFTVDFVGTGSGRRVHTRVSGGDPGYDETAKMLAESALCLAFDDNPETAGQVTTAQAMGDALTARLIRAGIRFEVVD